MDILLIKGVGQLA